MTQNVQVTISTWKWLDRVLCIQAESETVLVRPTLAADPGVKDWSASGLFRGWCQKTTRRGVGKWDSEERGAHKDCVGEQITAVDPWGSSQETSGACVELPLELLPVVNGNEEGGRVSG